MSKYFARTPGGSLARAAMPALAALAAGLFVSTASAQTLAPADIASLHFRAINVDTSAIAARSLPNYARRVHDAVLTRAREVFADRLAPGDSRAPTLVLRVESLTITGDGGFSRFRSRGGGRSRAAGAFADANDYLEGEGLVVTSRGAVIGRYPVLSSLGASYSGSTYISGSDERRISNIGWHFASWVRRNMGL
jgi:hypothetical protein